MKHACLCCGNRTLDEAPGGTFEICPVCYWEDDDAQARDPGFEGGANALSLNEARANYERLGVSDPRFADKVRKPTPGEAA